MIRRLVPSLKVCVAALSLLAPAGAAMAVPITVNYIDGAGEGFNDAALGSQRKAAFEYAVDIWGAKLRGTVAIVVDAAFDPLGGDATSATLGSAGATTIHRNFAGAPSANVWYAAGLASQLNGSDLNGATVEIEATFNSDVDGPVVFGARGFYYGTDLNAGADSDFVSVALHEMGHGLGFFDMVDSGTGAWNDSSPDAYGRLLTHQGVGNFTSLNDAQRRTALTSDAVFWIGSATTAAAGGSLKIFAPSPYEGGSSISHWDTSNSPDLLMEPSYTGPHHHLDYTEHAFEDIGWAINATPVANDDSASADTGVAKVINVLSNDSDTDDTLLSVTAVTQPANGSVINSGGGNVTYTSNAPFSGEDTFTYTVADIHGAKDIGAVTVTVSEPPAAAEAWTQY